jgi:hypothetical protein
LVRIFKLLIGVGTAEQNFTPSPLKIFAVAVLLGFLFLSIVTTLIIFTGTLL